MKNKKPLKLETASNYKDQYLSQYGVSFNIPSLYVQSSAWYPKDPSYFVQIVNYIVPKDQTVQTHFMHSEPMIENSLGEIFSDKIQGCIIRLIKTQPDLNSIKLIDQFAFKEIPRVDMLEIDFSKDGKFFTIYSKEHRILRVVEFQQIDDLLDEIRNDRYVIQKTDTDKIERVSFGCNSKFMIIKYSMSLEIYNIAMMC